jgi:hypothetical protein
LSEDLAELVAGGIDAALERGAVHVDAPRSLFDAAIFADKAQGL